jgi:hypothetical protein
MGRPRKYTLAEARELAAEAMAVAAEVMPVPVLDLPDAPAPPVCTGRMRWKGSSGAHPRGALQVAWQCAGGIEWRHIEIVGPDAPDAEDA